MFFRPVFEYHLKYLQSVIRSWQVIPPSILKISTSDLKTADLQNGIRFDKSKQIKVLTGYSKNKHNNLP